MTCTVAIVDGNVTIIASDAAATTGFSLALRRDNPKLWYVDEGAVGCCGDFNVCVWAKYGFKWPLRLEEDYMSWLVTKVQPALLSSLKRRFGGRKFTNDTLSLLFAAPGRIFVLSPCGDVEECINGFNAIGSGASEALAALWVLKEIKSPLLSWEKLDLALCASSEFSLGVKRPWSMLYAMN